MSSSDFKKTIRTVQLGFYQHTTTDAIVDVPLPIFEVDSPTPMPTSDTAEYWREGPCLYPSKDAEMGELARNVLSDLYWMCCCKGASSAVVSPTTRREGSVRLVNRVKEICETVADECLTIDSNAVILIAAKLGAPLAKADVTKLIESCGGKEGIIRKDNIVLLCHHLCEPVMGDCSSEVLSKLANGFADRASRAMHFLSRRGQMPAKYLDILIERLCIGCHRLVTMSEPTSPTIDSVNKWIKELFTGVPRVSDTHVSLSGTAESARTESSLFSSRRSVFIPYERRVQSAEEILLGDAIHGRVQQSAHIPAPPPKRPSSLRTTDTTAKSMPMRIGACSPALCSWFESPTVRRGLSSREIHLSVSQTKRSTNVSHTAFARLCTPAYHLSSVSPRAASPRRPEGRSSGDRQGRRELMRLAKTAKVTKEYTATLVDAIREEMASVLAAIAIGKYLIDTAAAVSELTRVKVLLDDAFANTMVMTNISTDDRKDIRDRSVLLRKLIGERTRAAEEQVKVNAIWKDYQSQTEVEI